jgi:hypothetical protein
MRDDVAPFRISAGRPARRALVERDGARISLETVQVADRGQPEP